MIKNRNREEITASLVLYENNEVKIKDVLRSLDYRSDYYYLTLIIVDNSSQKTNIKFNKFKKIKVIYIHNSVNIGFGRAHNLAINLSKKERFHVILNPDIWFEKDSIEKIYLFMISKKRVPAVSGLMVNQDETIQSFNRNDPNLLNLLLRRFFPNSFLSNIFDDNFVVPSDSILSSNNISGAFLLADKKILLTENGFDERFFLYLEDFDLSRRLRKYGKMMILKNIKIYHHRARGSYHSLKLFLFHTVSLFKYYFKWMSLKKILMIFFKKKKNSPTKKNITIISTSGFIVLNFFNEHIKLLSNSYNVKVLTPKNSFPKTPEPTLLYGCINYDIRREISVFRDFLSLILLTFYLIFNRNHLIISLGPKAGLIGGLAGLISLTKNRLFIFQGEVWVTKKGALKKILIFCDKLISLLNTNLLCVSKGEKDFLIKNNIVKNNKIKVLGSGSICGVDLNRFAPFDCSKTHKPNSKFTFAFMGRMNNDKGIHDLLNAFNLIKRKYTNINLIFAGIDEVNFADKIKFQERVSIIKYQEDVLAFLSSVNCLILPSYREALPVSILEAFALKIPVIGSNIYGINSLIEHCYTGMLFPPGDVGKLSKNMEALLNNRPLMKKITNNAYIMVAEKFNKDKVVKKYVKYFTKIIGS